MVYSVVVPGGAMVKAIVKTVLEAVVEEIISSLAGHSNPMVEN
jgi:hypothetical protein